MEIKKLLTKVNFNKKDSRSIKYIVIHYTGNDGDTAKNNAVYFENTDRGASAHYFVDENEIYQVVEDKDIAWHSGVDYSQGKAPYWNKVTNGNSIGIEMCSAKSNGQFYIPEQTKKNTIELVQILMQKYNIPAENVVRHFDVTYKSCPEPFVRDYDQWVRFKSELTKDEELELSIDKLATAGIIENRSWWLENYNKPEAIKYTRELIVKFTKHLT